MNAASATLTDKQLGQEELRTASQPDVLLNWPQQQSALCLWERQLPAALSTAADELASIDRPAEFRADWTPGADPSNVASDLSTSLATFNPASSHEALAPIADDALSLFMIAETLVSQLRQQLQSPKLSIRVERVTGDGCRLFHVDRLFARLLCTWSGPGTEWLPEGSFDRSGLGCGCNDHVLEPDAARQIPTGAVALLRGDACAGLEGAGLVHRSPPGRPGRARLLIAVDLR